MQQLESTTSTHVPPQDRQAEINLLGALLVDNDYIAPVCSVLNESDFYERRHAEIFKAIVQLYENNIPADLVTVTDKLQSNVMLDKVGGRAYLVELTEDVFSAAHSERYAEIVREKSILRRLMQLTSQIHGQAERMEGEVRDLLDEAEKRIFELSTMKPEKGVESIKTLLPATFKKLEEMPQLQGQVTGLACGFTDLDAMTSGMHSGELMIVAGRPGMGKTAFALRIMEHVAVELHQACAVFSMEMSNEQIVQRLLCSRAKVSSHRLRTGRLRDPEWTNLNYAVGPLSESPIYMDDSATLSIWDLRTKARLLKSQYNIQLLVVDYLQLMTAGGRVENRQQEISLISRSLKGLAKELGIPIIACSQLSRQVETRGENKRPQLADLRESGAIEQDADVVMFVYRPAAYKLSAEEREELRGTEEENLAEIIVAKQRNGPTGIAKLTFMDDCIRFENREHRRPEAGPPGEVPF
ncbi:MAG: replicative DNA helicase [bacterium]